MSRPDGSQQLAQVAPSPVPTSLHQQGPPLLFLGRRGPPPPLAGCREFLRLENFQP